MIESTCTAPRPKQDVRDPSSEAQRDDAAEACRCAVIPRRFRCASLVSCCLSPARRIARIPCLYHGAVAAPLAVEAALAVAMTTTVSDSAVIAVTVFLPAAPLAVAALAVVCAVQINSLRREAVRRENEFAESCVQHLRFCVNVNLLSAPTRLDTLVPSC